MIKNYVDLFYIKINCKKFLDLNLYSYQTFSNLAKCLNNKNILEQSKKFLQIFLNNNIHTKKFLTCFMIKHHPNVIISNNTNIEKQMLVISQKLINNILNISNSNN